MVCSLRSLGFLVKRSSGAIEGRFSLFTPSCRLTRSAPNDNSNYVEPPAPQEPLPPWHESEIRAQVAARREQAARPARAQFASAQNVVTPLGTRNDNVQQSFSLPVLRVGSHAQVYEQHRSSLLAVKNSNKENCSAPNAARQFKPASASDATNGSSHWTFTISKDPSVDGGGVTVPKNSHVADFWTAQSSSSQKLRATSPPLVHHEAAASRLATPSVKVQPLSIPDNPVLERRINNIRQRHAERHAKQNAANQAKQRLRDNEPYTESELKLWEESANVKSFSATMAGLRAKFGYLYEQPETKLSGLTLKSRRRTVSKKPAVNQDGTNSNSRVSDSPSAAAGECNSTVSAASHTASTKRKQRAVENGLATQNSSVSNVSRASGCPRAVLTVISSNLADTTTAKAAAKLPVLVVGPEPSDSEQTLKQASIESAFKAYAKGRHPSKKIGTSRQLSVVPEHSVLDFSSAAAGECNSTVLVAADTATAKRTQRAVDNGLATQNSSVSNVSRASGHNSAVSTNLSQQAGATTANAMAKLTSMIPSNVPDKTTAKATAKLPVPVVGPETNNPRASDFLPALKLDGNASKIMSKLDDQSSKLNKHGTDKAPSTSKTSSVLIESLVPESNVIAPMASNNLPGKAATVDTPTVKKGCALKNSKVSTSSKPTGSMDAISDPALKVVNQVATTTPMLEQPGNEKVSSEKMGAAYQGPAKGFHEREPIDIKDPRLFAPFAVMPADAPTYGQLCTYGQLGTRGFPEEYDPSIHGYTLKTVPVPDAKAKLDTPNSKTSRNNRSLTASSSKERGKTRTGSTKSSVSRQPQQREKGQALKGLNDVADTKEGRSQNSSISRQSLARGYHRGDPTDVVDPRLKASFAKMSKVTQPGLARMDSSAVEPIYKSPNGSDSDNFDWRLSPTTSEEGSPSPRDNAKKTLPSHSPKQKVYV
jgi:hypothetical protein